MFAPVLLLTSWAGVIAGYSLKWMDDTGAQNKHAWSLLIVTLFLPALGVLFFNRRKNVTAASCEAS